METGADIKIVPIDTCYLKIEADESIRMELSEKLTFSVPDYEYTIAYQNGTWDGKVYCYSFHRNRLMAGLLYHVILYAKRNNYSIEVSEELLKKSITQENFDKLYEMFNFPKHFRKEDHQTTLIKKALEYRRAILKSPTGSGKSLIIYALCRTLLMKYPKKKALIVVPTKNLVSQFAKEIEEYGFTGSISKYSETKDFSGNIVISTYHSLYKLKRNFFNRFSIIVCDEVHGFDSKSTLTLMSKTDSIPYKFGTTATLKDTKSHIMQLQGLFGLIISHTTTKELIDAGKLTPAKIYTIILNHCDKNKKLNYNKTERRSAAYKKELDIIFESKARFKFIIELIKRCTKNTLVLFTLIKHGKELYDKLKELGIKVYYIDGSTSSDDRELIRQTMEKEQNAVLVASSSTTATGFNCKNLHNVIFAHPSKSKIRVLQSIGRILRLLEGKQEVKVFDIVDDLSWKDKSNIILEHFNYRHNIYNMEQFPITLMEIQLDE